VSRRASRQQESRQRAQERRRVRDQRREDGAIAAELGARAGRAVPTTPTPPAVPSPAARHDDSAGAGADTGAHVLTTGRRVPGQQLACGWCGQPITIRHTGRMPKWCSPVCRHRAWEQSRAAASGRAAVEVVDRYVAAVPADGPGWLTQLSLLASQITHQHGQIPDRDLDQIAAALELAQAAIVGRTPSGSQHDPRDRY